MEAGGREAAAQRQTQKKAEEEVADVLEEQPDPDP